MPAPAVRPGTDGVDPRSSSRVLLTRTPQGWKVLFPAGEEEAGCLLEALSLADLIADELGVRSEPDRTARRSARGPGPAEVAPADARDARLAELERTVAQLEHALAARVSTEQAIGVLAERHATTPRAAFEELRRTARSQGRAVAELAREVLDGLRPSADGEQRSHERPEPGAGAPATYRGDLSLAGGAPSRPPAPRRLSPRGGANRSRPAGGPELGAAADGRH